MGAYGRDRLKVGQKNYSNETMYDEKLHRIWPVRRRFESPVDYYKRTHSVDACYHFVYKGRYYCNPAHCSQSWTDKAERDAHLEKAYAILD
jgi:hypothetical protein